MASSGGKAREVVSLGVGSQVQQIEDAMEREVQRRVTAILVAAGVPQSIIRMQVLYMLPTEFVKAYESTFDACFGPASGLSSSGLGRHDPDEQPKKIGPTKIGQSMRVRGKDQSGMDPNAIDPDTGKRVRGTEVGGTVGSVSRRGGDAFGGGARGEGGKRFREHWPIRSEKAMRKKASVDRKLMRLAQEMMKGFDD